MSASSYPSLSQSFPYSPRATRSPSPTGMLATKDLRSPIRREQDDTNLERAPPSLLDVSFGTDALGFASAEVERKSMLVRIRALELQMSTVPSLESIQGTYRRELKIHMASTLAKLRREVEALRAEFKKLKLRVDALEARERGVTVSLWDPEEQVEFLKHRKRLQRNREKLGL